MFPCMMSTRKCKNVVVTGANRGIGLELVKQLISRYNPDNVFATYRDADSSKELLDLASQHKNLHTFVLDVRATEKYGEFVSQVDAATKGAGINLLINNSGYFNKKNNNSLSELSKDDLMFHLEVNAVAPIMLTQAFLPLLEKASQASSNDPLGISRAVVLQMSTILASFGSNTNAGAYGYRISKTAQNQASKIMSIELLNKGILVVPVHPGWVKTDMGGSNAMISTEESVSGMISVLEQLNVNNTGQFMGFDGHQIPW